MFEDLRLKITLMFVGLSAVIYITLSLLGLVIFEHGLTASIDDELKVIVSQIGHAIDVQGDRPKFRDWIRTVRTDPVRSLVTIQLFDSQGRLLEHYGPAGVERLIPSAREWKQGGQCVRVACSPIMQGNLTRGYVQLQQSTRQRDEALQQLQVNAFYIGVLFLGSLSAASYWVAYRVTLPIKESVQILKTFVADASHELNTPLTILQARLETLERRLQKLGVEEDDLKVAVSSMDRLNQVVNDLLLLSEVEDPLLTMKRKPVDVALVAGAAVEEVKDRFREKTVELSAEAMTSVIVTGNAEALHRALSNLLENALRYTNEGGNVVVRLLTTEKTVAIAVTDTGIGIPEESLPRICDRFVRVDKSRSRASGGTGLGLAIVKAVADAHRGTLDIESKLGVGSTFTLSLPRTR